MKKNDKIIAVLGVIILLLAGIGVYYWDSEETTVSAVEMDDFLSHLALWQRCLIR